jgi:hypothetical protein
LTGEQDRHDINPVHHKDLSPSEVGYMEYKEIMETIIGCAHRVHLVESEGYSTGAFEIRLNWGRTTG